MEKGSLIHHSSACRRQNESAGQRVLTLPSNRAFPRVLIPLASGPAGYPHRSSRSGSSASGARLPVQGQLAGQGPRRVQPPEGRPDHEVGQELGDRDGEARRRAGDLGQLHEVHLLPDGLAVLDHRGGGGEGRNNQIAN